MPIFGRASVPANPLISGKLTISPKYRADKIEASVEDGILKVVFGLAKDVSLIPVK